MNKSVDNSSKYVPNKLKQRKNSSTTLQVSAAGADMFRLRLLKRLSGIIQRLYKKNGLTSDDIRTEHADRSRGKWRLAAEDERLVATGPSELPWVSISVLSSLGPCLWLQAPSLFHRDCLMPCNEPHNTPRWASGDFGVVPSAALLPRPLSVCCVHQEAQHSSHQHHLTALVMLVMLKKRQISFYTDDVQKHPCCLSCSCSWRTAQKTNKSALHSSVWSVLCIYLILFLWLLCESVYNQVNVSMNSVFSHLLRPVFFPVLSVHLFPISFGKENNSVNKKLIITEIVWLCQNAKFIPVKFFSSLKHLGYNDDIWLCSIASFCSSAAWVELTQHVF